MSDPSLPVLTLHQPWSSLIAVGIKRIETRSWPAPKSIIGQRIAIHAAKRKPMEDQQVGPYQVHEMADDSWAMHKADTLAFDPLPLGCIIATARLDASLPIVEPSKVHPSSSLGMGCIATTQPNLSRSPELMLWHDGETYGHVIEDQRPYGDFTPGRYGWVLSDIRMVNPPLPFVGGQGFSKRWTP